MPNVRVGGAVDDVAAFLASVDAVVVPSRWEAFGQVALEARAAGRPVIVTAVDGLIEQVEPGCGVQVPAGDTEKLAAALRGLAGAEGFAAMAFAARASTDDHMARSVAAWFDVLGVFAHAGTIPELRGQQGIAARGAGS